jgi:hypothetical protein
MCNTLKTKDKINEMPIITPTPSRLVNFHHKKIQELIQQRGWYKLDKPERIKAAYDFCREEILFGYNKGGDAIPASEVLSDGIGQCNTKAILFMALLRAMNIPCRLHTYMVDKRMQKGAVGRTAYLVAPKEIIHTTVEVRYGDGWVNLEGIILDEDYIGGVQDMFAGHKGSFCGYAIGVDDFQNPHIEFDGGDTSIQSTSIVRDLGVFNSPDEFYKENGTNTNGLKTVFYKTVLHRLMNRNVQKIRSRSA